MRATFVLVLAAIIIIISALLVARPFWDLWGISPRPGALSDPARCRICYLALLCTPALELALAAVALGMGFNLLLSPDLMIRTTAPMLQTLHAAAPQWAWATGALTVGALHSCAPFATLPEIRFTGLILSVIWWLFLAVTAWPFRQEAIGFGFYVGMSAIAVLALWGFSLERGRAGT